MKRIIKKCSVLLVVCTFLFTPCNFSFADADTQGPTVDFATLQVSKTEVRVGEAVKLSFKVEDESDIAEVRCSVIQGNGGMMGYGVESNVETGVWTFTYTPNYYGTCEIMDITVSDANGNVTRYLNSKYSRYGEGLYDWDNEANIKVDMSSANFKVVGGNGNDTAGPTLVKDSLAVDKTEVSVNNSFKLQFKVQDASDIAEIYLDIMQANGHLMGAGIEKDANGNWIYTFTPNYAGKTEIIGIKIIDAYGNETHYINSSNSKFGETGYNWGNASRVLVDLSGVNVNVLGGKVEDVKGPQIVADTLSVDKLQIKVHETSKISFKVIDESEIAEVRCSVTQGNGSLMGYGVRVDNNTGIWTFSFTPEYYGVVEIQSIQVTDANGNKTFYVNSAHSKFGASGYDWGNDNRISADLSAANFYVGIRDEETGIFVSGSDVTDDTKLEVDEKEYNGDDYEKMKEHSHKHDGHKHHNHNPHGYYEIQVKNHHNGGNKFKVFFDVPWAKDGEIVRVSHMKHDGTIQIEDIPAKGGKVCMEVAEFSPFLVEQIVMNNDSNTNSNDAAGNETNNTQDNNISDTQDTNSDVAENKITEDASNTETNKGGETSSKLGAEIVIFVVVLLVVIGVGVFVIIKKKANSKIGSFITADREEIK